MPEEIVDTNKEVQLSLDQSMAKAKETLDAGEKSEKKTPKAEKTEEKKESDKKADDDLTPEEIETAKNLLRALKDPTQAPAAIDYLAKQGGYTKAEVKELKETLKEGTKAEVVEAKDELVALFEDQFGEEFAKKIAPVLNKAVEKLVDSKTKEITDTFNRAEMTKTEQEASSILDSIANEFYDEDEFPKEISAEMSKLMDTYKKSSSQSLKDYLSDIHSLAASRKGGNTKPLDKTKQERIAKNKSDIAGKISSQRSPSPASGDPGDKPSTFKNLDAAIAAAAEKLSKE